MIKSRPLVPCQSVTPVWPLWLVILFISLLVLGCQPKRPAFTFDYTSMYASSAEKASLAVIEKDPFLESGYAIRWNHKINKLIYMKKQRDGYYDMFMANSDGSNEIPLTVDHPGLPNRHQGAGEWHPDGKYILFVGELEEHEGGSYAALPGFGGYSNILLMKIDGRKVWQLTDMPDDYAKGILLPTFSPDGRRVVWAERYKRPHIFTPRLGLGAYTIKIADFIDGETPHLSNVREIQLGGEAFYEVSDFSPDGQSILFSSNFETPQLFQNQVYKYDLNTGKLLRLTQEGWNEHPGYAPDGKTIIYMSNHQAEKVKWFLGTDWWLINDDGTNRRRITFMNSHNHPHRDGNSYISGTVTWSPDGKWFYGDVQDSLIGQTGKVVKVNLFAEK